MLVWVAGDGRRATGDGRRATGDGRKLIRREEREQARSACDFIWIGSERSEERERLATDGQSQKVRRAARVAPSGFPYALNPTNFVWYNSGHSGASRLLGGQSSPAFDF